MDAIAWLDGEWMPLEEARIPACDRGAMFGDGVYEVIRTYDGRPWALDLHLERLARSAREIRLEGADMEVVRALVEEGNRRAGHASARIYVQITRGTAPRAHAWPAGMRPGLLVTVESLPPLPEERYEAGAAAITLPDIRWRRRDIKCLNLLPNVLARQEAAEAGADEAVLVEPDGLVTEASAHSLFAVLEGVVLTREEGPHILSGVTRVLVLECARRLGLPLCEGPFTMRQLRAAEELFLTGTSPGVWALTRLDGAPVGDGRPGPVTRRIAARYFQRVAEQDDRPG